MGGETVVLFVKIYVRNYIVIKKLTNVIVRLRNTE